jgi:hypothetical protein
MFHHFVWVLFPMCRPTMIWTNKRVSIRENVQKRVLLALLFKRLRLYWYLINSHCTNNCINTSSLKYITSQTLRLHSCFSLLSMSMNFFVYCNDLFTKKKKNHDKILFKYDKWRNYHESWNCWEEGHNDQQESNNKIFTREILLEIHVEWI